MVEMGGDRGVAGVFEERESSWRGIEMKYGHEDEIGMSLKKGERLLGSLVIQEKGEKEKLGGKGGPVPFTWRVG